MFIRWLGLLLLFATQASAATLTDQIIAQAPAANPEVIRLAVKALECVSRDVKSHSDVLTVIDYSRNSTVPRMWVFDMEKRTLLFEELVAHGKNSGDDITVHFSNKPGSKASSLGLFLTADSYEGGNGYSLRLHGLEPGINDNAFDRQIVIHGADYVSKDTCAQLGRLGRSWGCPAVRKEIAHKLIDTIKDGRIVFIYGTDAHWLEHSKYLKCARSEPNSPRIDESLH